MKRLLVRLGPYTASVILTFAVGVLSVPAIIALAGSAQWASLAVVQSVAAFATVFVAFGWGATGPNQIATLNDAARPAAFVRSVYARSALYLVVGPLTAALCVLLTDLPPAAAIMGGIAYSMQALGAVWFFVGESRPFRVLVFDAVPRASGIIGGVIALWLSQSIIAFTAVLLAAAVVSQVLSYRAGVTGAGQLPGPRLTDIGHDLMTQRHGVLTTSAASLYYNSSLVVCSIFAPNAVEPYALAFKLYNYAGAALVPVLQFAQSWIPAGGLDDVPRRVRAASLTALAAALPLTVAAIVLLPVVGGALSFRSIDISLALAVPVGVCIGTILVNQVVGQASLVAIGKVRSLAWSATVGAVVGVALQIAGTLYAGAIGLAMAVAITDLCVIGFQTAVVFSWLRGQSGREATKAAP